MAKSEPSSTGKKKPAASKASTVAKVSAKKLPASKSPATKSPASKPAAKKPAASSSNGADKPKTPRTKAKKETQKEGQSTEDEDLLKLPVADDDNEGDESGAEEEKPSSQPLALDAASTKKLTDKLKRVPQAPSEEPKEEPKKKRKKKNAADEETIATDEVETPLEERGVIYLGHIPHGFYEDQLKGFFGQFGTVSRLKLSRSKKTGRSKHYAFIEFAHKEVGPIVADAMNNYLMFGRLLKCHTVPFEKVHPETFKNAHRKFDKKDWAKKEAKRHNKTRTPEQHSQRVGALVKRESKKRKKLAALGVDYEFEGFAEQAKKGKKAKASA